MSDRNSSVPEPLRSIINAASPLVQAEREYAFDVKLWAVVRVTAASEAEARDKMRDQLTSFDLNHDRDGLLIEGLSAEDIGEDELVEIDGEAV